MANKFLVKLTSKTATEGNVVSEYSWFQTAMQRQSC